MVSVKSRSQVISDVVHHNIASKRSHSNLIWFVPHRHAGDRTSCWRKTLFFVQEVSLCSDVMQKKTSLLCGTAEDVLLVSKWKNYIDDRINFVIGIRQRYV